MWLAPVLKQNIVPLLIPHFSSFGFDSFSKTYCDNQSVIHIAHNDVFHERTKHIEIGYYFIHFHLVHGALKLISVSSKDQLVDIFTSHILKDTFVFWLTTSSWSHIHLEFEGDC